MAKVYPSPEGAHAARNCGLGQTIKPWEGSANATLSPTTSVTTLKWGPVGRDRYTNAGKDN